MDETVSNLSEGPTRAHQHPPAAYLTPHPALERIRAELHTLLHHFSSPSHVSVNATRTSSPADGEHAGACKNAASESDTKVSARSSATSRCCGSCDPAVPVSTAASSLTSCDAAVCPCPSSSGFVHAAWIAETDWFGRRLSAGWRLLMDLRAPAGSAYAAGDPLYRIELDMPVDYPRKQPRLRWVTIMYHPQILEMGLLRNPALLGWDEGKSLADIVAFCHLLLGGPEFGPLPHSSAPPPIGESCVVDSLSKGILLDREKSNADCGDGTPASSLSLPSGAAAAAAAAASSEDLRASGDEESQTTDEELQQMWSEHDPACQCSMVEGLPSYAEFLTMGKDHQQAILNMLRQRLAQAEAAEESHDTGTEDGRQRLFSAFEQSGQYTKELHLTARAWAQMTTFPGLYRGGWQREWLAPSFLKAIESGGRREDFAAILREELPGVYSFALFRPEFCQRLQEEMVAYESSALPKHRPNSMNNYGLILDRLGLEHQITDLITTFLQPLVSQLYVEETGGFAIDNHHAFLVQYMEGEDLNLDMHSDDSEVTVNVNICDAFTGAGLRFCGVHGHQDRRRVQGQYQHTLGRAVIHAGLHRHGAEDLVSGKRYNVILWLRSSRYRETPQYHGRMSAGHPREHRPDLMCLSRTHDSDYTFWTKRERAQGERGGE